MAGGAARDGLRCRFRGAGERRKPVLALSVPA